MSYLTDLPSPKAWQKYTTLVDKVRTIITSNAKESHSIKTTISDITEDTKKLTEAYERLDRKTWKLSGNLDSFKYYLLAQEKIDSICRSGNIIADNLIREANTLYNIRQKSRLNQPDDSLYPLKEVQEKTRLLEKEKGIPGQKTSAAFKESHELEKIFAMSACVTTISENVIHSVLAIPRVNLDKNTNSLI